MKELSFEDFVKLCRDADILIDKLKRKTVRLQGRKPRTLKAAAVYYLARKRGLHVTTHHLMMIYGFPTMRAIIEVRKLIENVVEEVQLGVFSV